MKMIHWIKSSLIAKIILFILSILFLINSAASFITYKQIQTQTERLIQEQLQSTSYSIRANLDVDKLELIMTNNTPNSSEYQQLNTYLHNCLKDASFKYLYTFGKLSDGQFYYLVDSLREDNEDFSPYGTPIDLDKEDFMTIGKVALTDDIFFTDIEYYEEWGHLISTYVPLFNSKGQPVAFLGLDYVASDYNKKVNVLSTRIWIVFFISTLIASAILTIYLTKKISPLTTIQKAILALSTGDLNLALEKRSEDEIGSICSAFNQMTHKLRSMVEILKGATSNLSIHAKDLVGKSKQSYDFSSSISQNALRMQEATQLSKASMENITDKMSDIKVEMETIHDKIENVVTCSNETFDHTQDGEHMVKQIATQAHETNAMIEDGKSQLLYLQQSIQDINHFIKVIADISRQTRLLAVNAAIEASHAHQGTTSFKVIADEVTKLAEQSNSAAKEATTILDQITHQTALTVQTLEDSFKHIQQTMISTENTVSYFEKISASTHLIKENIESVKQNMASYVIENYKILDRIQTADGNMTSLFNDSEKICSITQEQFADAHQLLKWAEDLHQLSHEIQQQMNFFK